MAERLRARRLELGLSLAELARSSGVSKAMISKVEATASSPTAGVLGRLCNGLGITMSALMAAVESEDATELPAARQPRWEDRATGVERVAVSPRATFSSVEIARLRLRSGAVVDYPTPPSVAYAQHILGISGSMRFTVGHSSFVVGPGDCVAARIDRPTRFGVLGDDPAEYLVIVEQASR
ncbi:MAG: helix-turn-helix domain-containing protein [Gaiellaceae bacterium]